MKVQFGAVLKSITGEPLFEMAEDGKKEDVTLKRAVINALMAILPDEKNIGGEEKLKRYLLAQKIQGGNLEVTPEEVTMIKQLVGKVYGTAVVGPAFKLLNGD